MNHADIMAQPNFQRVAEAFETAKQECLLIPNIPAVNQGQDLASLIRELRTAMTEIRTEMRTEMHGMRGDIAAFRADFNSFRTDITTRLDASETNITARLYNSTINNPQTPFRPLRDRANGPVQSFPRNGHALSHLTAADVGIVLRAYELPTDGNLEEKRRRLAEFIGIVVRVV